MTELWLACFVLIVLRGGMKRSSARGRHRPGPHATVAARPVRATPALTQVAGYQRAQLLTTGADLWPPSLRPRPYVGVPPFVVAEPVSPVVLFRHDPLTAPFAVPIEHAAYFLEVTQEIDARGGAR